MLDEDGTFAERCNTNMVQLEPVLTEAEQEGKLARELWHRGLPDEVVLKRLLQNQVKHTGSTQAKKILDAWTQYRAAFVKVFPHEYRRALGELAAKNGKIAA